MALCAFLSSHKAASSHCEWCKGTSPTDDVLSQTSQSGTHTPGRKQDGECWSKPRWGICCVAPWANGLPLANSFSLRCNESTGARPRTNKPRETLRPINRFPACAWCFTSDMASSAMEYPRYLICSGFEWAVIPEPWWAWWLTWWRNDSQDHFQGGNCTRDQLFFGQEVEMSSRT